MRPEHIEHVLMNLHEGQWFGFSDPFNKTYENLEIYGGQEKPTKDSLESELTRLQTEYDGLGYARARAAAYPADSDFKEAWTEKEIGGDSTKWDAYVIAYNKVRTDNPK
jgi:hypothetical protein